MRTLFHGAMLSNSRVVELLLSHIQLAELPNTDLADRGPDFSADELDDVEVGWLSAIDGGNVESQL